MSESPDVKQGVSQLGLWLWIGGVAGMILFLICGVSFGAAGVPFVIAAVLAGVAGAVGFFMVIGTLDRIDK